MSLSIVCVCVSVVDLQIECFPGFNIICSNWRLLFSNYVAIIKWILNGVHCRQVWRMDLQAEPLSSDSHHRNGWFIWFWQEFKSPAPQLSLAVICQFPVCESALNFIHRGERDCTSTQVRHFLQLLLTAEVFYDRQKARNPHRSDALLQLWRPYKVYVKKKKSE